MDINPVQMFYASIGMNIALFFALAAFILLSGQLGVKAAWATLTKRPLLIYSLPTGKGKAIVPKQSVGNLLLKDGEIVAIPGDTILIGKLPVVIGNYRLGISINPHYATLINTLKEHGIEDGEELEKIVKREAEKVLRTELKKRGVKKEEMEGLGFKELFKIAKEHFGEQEVEKWFKNSKRLEIVKGINLYDFWRYIKYNVNPSYITARVAARVKAEMEGERDPIKKYFPIILAVGVVAILLGIAYTIVKNQNAISIDQCKELIVTAKTGANVTLQMGENPPSGFLVR